MGTSSPITANAATTASPAWRRCRPLWFRVNTPIRIAWIVASVLVAPLRRHFFYKPNRLQAFILVRDLHTSLNGLVQAFQYQGILTEHITLVDSGSTAPLCLAELQRLSTLGCNWLCLNQDDQLYGPYAPWLSSVLQNVIRHQSYPYLVTDADLVLPED